MKYLKFILTIIAFCLLAITFNLLGFIPSASANSNSTHFTTVPVNADGSLNVKFVKGETLDVNIDEVGGRSQTSGTLDVNLDEVDNSSADYPLHVETDN
ncbi:MAG: hypothetical protein ABI405_10840 [Parafilimonas sp.]